MTRVIDLNGPQGNAISLIGIAKDLAGQLDQMVGFDEIQKQMMSSDYSNLISIFEANYGDYVTLTNKPDEEADDE